MRRSGCALVLAAIVTLPPAALGQDQADLAKASQNPVAAMISVPFQNNAFFGVGPDDDVANVLNIQPVIPIHLGPVNLINRTIVPLIYLPDLTSGLQQAHKYEKGINRVAAGRLYHISQALGVEVGYFFEGLGRDNPVKATPQQRLLLELGRNFSAIPIRKHQDAICSLARTMAEPAAGD